MPIRTRMLHENEEYLVVEEGGDPVRPPLKIFARATNEKAGGSKSSPAYSTEQGLWCLVASYDGKEIRALGNSGSQVLATQEDVAQKLVRHYLLQRAEAKRSSPHSYFYLAAEGRPAHDLIRAQPGGLVLRLFREEEQAKEALRDWGMAGTIERTGALREFLALRSEEGFAGAVLDENEPVYWCVDGQSQLQFLKVRVDASAETLEEHLLDARGQWQVYEGDEMLDLFEDQDAWDQLMQQVLGAQPFLGYDAFPAFYSLFDGDTPVFLEEQTEDEQVQRVLPVFHDQEAARAFADGEEMYEAEVRSVDDLHQLLTDAAAEGAVSRLHPGDHRCRGGNLWVDGRRVVLDSFSGFWGSEDGREFVRYA